MAPKITSREELEAWLETQSADVRQLMSLRAVLRSFPLICDPDSWFDLTPKSDVILATTRALCLASSAVLNWGSVSPAPLVAAHDHAEHVAFGAAKRGPIQTPADPLAVALAAGELANLQTRKQVTSWAEVLQ